MRIQNSRKTMSVALALAAALATASNTAAHANSFSTNTEQLPDASKPFQARRKIQIVDESPEVTDRRHAQENTVYQINVAPMPQSTTHVVQIGDPSAGAGASNRAGNSNTIPIMHNSLPFAGPTSNIAPHQSMGNQLPKGFSTQGLTGTLAKKPGQATPMAQSTPMAKPMASTRPTAVATYPTTTPSSSVNQSMSTKTKVVGSLLHPEKDK